MSVFYTILAKCIHMPDASYNSIIQKKPDYKTFSDSLFSIDSNIMEQIDNSNHMYYFLTGFIHNKEKTLSTIANKKFKYFKEYNENPFTSPTSKIEFNTKFNILQKHYLALSKFVHIVKHKIAQTANESDMYLNSINHKKNNCCVLHNSRKYIFTLHDLKEIINTSLSREDYGFPDIQSIKNPYDNTPFNQSNLYNIYFFFKFSYYNVPTLFHSFFLHNLNLSYFQEYNEYDIRKFNIDSFFRINNENRIDREIRRMFSYYNKKKPQRFQFREINDNFPKQLLAKIMKPYLRLYLLSKKSLNTRQKTACEEEFMNKMYKLIKYNPIFGRKIVKKDKLSKKMRITYSSKCPDFENINNITDPLCHTHKRNRPSEDMQHDEEVVESVSQLENVLQMNSSVVENVNTFLTSQQGFSQPFFRTSSSNNISNNNNHSDFFQNMLLDTSNNQTNNTLSNIPSNLPNSEFHHLFQGIHNYNLYSDQDNSGSSNSIPNLLNVAENYNQESNNETASETDDSDDTDDDVAIIVDRVGRTLSFSSDSEF